MEGWSYRGQNYSKFKTEIEGKSISARVRARFKLSGVNCSIPLILDRISDFLARFLQISSNAHECFPLC